MKHRSIGLQSGSWLVRAAALWLGLLLLLLLVTSTPGAQRYDIGAPSDERVTASFWQREQGGNGSLRWTNGHSMIRFHGYQPARALLVALQMTSIQEPAAPLPLTIALDGRPVISTTALPAWRTYHILAVPSSARWQTPQLELISPTSRIGPQDGRDLGLALAEVWVHPSDMRQAGPLLERAAFFATLLTLLFLTLGRRLRASIAWSITLAAGTLIVVASLIRPADLAYVVPPLWALLFLVAGLSAVWLFKTPTGWIGGTVRWAGLGLLLALAGQLLLRIQLESVWLNLLGGALLLGGGWLAAAALQGNHEDTRMPAGEQSETHLPVWLLLGGCLLLALALRLYQLGSVPFGMWRDEARHALLALRILDDPGFRPVYVSHEPIRADLPALLFYLQAIPVALLGPTVVAARLVPALLGSLTVIPIYVLGRRLLGPAVGLAGALLLAVSSWHIALSRFASPAVLDPFFTLSGLVLLDHAISAHGRAGRHRQLFLALAAGVSMALALYTYHTSRLVPLVAATLIAYRLGLHWHSWRRVLPTLAAFTLGAVLVATPLIHYMLTSPETFNRRINQIGSVAETEWHATPAAAFEENVASYALMWNVQGERNARHHVPLVPLVDPFTGLLFIIGLILLLRDWRLFPARLLLTLLLLGLLPGLLSSDAPHALRSIAVVAPTMLIAAVALAALLALVQRSRPGTKAALAVGTLAAAALFNIWIYFGHTPYDPRIWNMFEYTRETAIGSYLRQSRDGPRAVLPQAVAASDVLQYLTYDMGVQIVSTASPPSLLSNVRLIIPSDASADTWRWAQQSVGPSIRARPMHPFPSTDQPTFWLFEAP